MLAEGDIRRIAARVAKGYGPLVVATFGSYAIGTARARSDLDLLVIKHTPEPAGARRRTVARLLFGVLHALDVHVFTPEEFEDGAYQVQSFIWVIAQQARIYHVAEHAARWVPSLAARMVESATMVAPVE